MHVCFYSKEGKWILKNKKPISNKDTRYIVIHRKYVLQLQINIDNHRQKVLMRQILSALWFECEMYNMSWCVWTIRFSAWGSFFSFESLFYFLRLYLYKLKLPFPFLPSKSPIHQVWYCLWPLEGRNSWSKRTTEVLKPDLTYYLLSAFSLWARWSAASSPIAFQTFSIMMDWSTTLAIRQNKLFHFKDRL